MSRATRKRALDQTGLAASITSFNGDCQAFHLFVLLVSEPQANIGSVGPVHYVSQEEGRIAIGLIVTAVSTFLLQTSRIIIPAIFQVEYKAVVFPEVPFRRASVKNSSSLLVDEAARSKQHIRPGRVATVFRSIGNGQPSSRVSSTGAKR